MLELVWTAAPGWLGGTVDLAVGWVAVVATPQLFARLGLAGGLLIVAGGLIYSAGAAIYALRRPDPVPAVVGGHEVFHLLVIAGVPPTSWRSACSPSAHLQRGPDQRTSSQVVTGADR